MKTIDLGSLTKRKSASEIVIHLGCADSDKLFFNGFQTWTPSREFSPTDNMPPLKPFFRIAGRPWGTARYGDDYFMDYSGAPGVFHGFTYMYRRSGDLFTLIGSTDETNGYTIFRYDAMMSELTITKDAGFKGKFDTDLHIAAFEGTEDEVYDAWFAASGIKRRPAEPMAGYGSWYNHYDKINSRTINEDLDGCSGILEPGDLFQIDDGWQMAVGDWSVNTERFPDGLKVMADEIHARGFKAGLWLAPFAAQADSALVREHPEWLLTHDRKPWYAGCNWGGFYALDIDVPEVREYVSKTLDTVINEWGFELVKLDFLYAAAPWMTARGEYFGESRGERMCRAMRYLREWCGDCMILGCGVPLGPAFGQVEYCRIGCDANLEWDNGFFMRNANREYPSTRNAIYDSYYRRGLDGRAFLNDPDVFFLRTDNIKLSEEQKDLHARVLAQYGSFFLTSDNMGSYDAGQREHYRQLRELWKNKDWTDRSFIDSVK